MTGSPEGPRTVLADGCPVILGPGVLTGLDTLVQQESTAGQRFLLGDENTLRHALPVLLAHVPALREASLIAIQPGERSKSPEVCHAIWSHLARHAAERDALLVNLGGGVVTDVGGFVASTFKRGIRWVNVPTSLMGMVDAAIGGKTGIDLDGVKNLVGTLRQPRAVFVHVPFLKTLGKRELLNGVAEMLKHGAILDADHWHAVRGASLHDLDALTPLVHRSAELKCGVVDRDPEERGERRLLNFGHTIGHALEAASWEAAQRGLTHGEAVAIGMLCEAWLAWRMDLLDREACDAIAHAVMELFPPYSLASTDHHRILSLMANDKKNAEGRFRFSLPVALGRGRHDVVVTAAQVGEALDHYRLLARDARHTNDTSA